MRVYKKALKDVLDISKRVLKSKDKKGELILQCIDGEKIIAGTKNENSLVALSEITNLDGETFSFVVNPYDLEASVAGKKGDKSTERHYAIEGEFIIEKDHKKKLQINQYKQRIKVPYGDFQEFKDKETFIKVLKESESLLSKTEKYCSAFLKMDSKKAMVLEPKSMNYFRLDEDFPFDEAVLHMEDIKVLKPSLKGELTLSAYKGYMVLKSDILPKGKGKEKAGVTHHFQVKIDHVVPFPDLTKLQQTKPIGLFTINADEMNSSLKEIKAKSKRVELHKEENGEFIDSSGSVFGEVKTNILIDPLHTEYNEQRVGILSLEGEFPGAKFDTSAFKNLFMGFRGDVEVQYKKFRNASQEVGEMWRISNPYKSSTVAGISQHDYDKIDVEIEDKMKRRMDFENRHL